MRLFFIHYLKIIFLYLGLHRIFKPFSGFFLNMYYLTALSAWAGKHENIPFNDFPTKWDYTKRFGLYEFMIKNENLQETPLNYMEFGVADGHSIKWFVEKNTNPSSTFHGFDTFTGLPEDFGIYKKGQFNTDNKVPEINDERVHFYPGLFQQTLPGFTKNINWKKRNVIMLDADLYSATLYVLTSLAPFLKKDDIIFFDEFLVPTHEFKAFHDFLQAWPVRMELAAAANNYYFAAFRIV